MAEAYTLAGKAERLLFEVEKLSGGIRVDRLQRDPKYLFSLHRALSRNLDELDDLRNKIEFRSGVYTAYPRPSLRPPSFKQFAPREQTPAEISHLVRYAKIRSAQISVIKATIDRLRAAIAAHRIAINHLLEYIAAGCRTCGRIAQGRIALKAMETHKCPNCSAPEILFAPSDVGISRVELIPFLPLAGDYMKRITQLPSSARATYVRITRFLREPVGRGARLILVTVRLRIGNKTLRRRLRFSAEGGEALNYEALIREQFGPSAHIESVRYRRTQPVLLSDRYTRACIALAYVNLTYEAWYAKHSKILELTKKIDVEKTLLRLPLYVLTYDLAYYFLARSPRSRRRLTSPFPHLESSPQFGRVEPMLTVLEDEDTILTAKKLGLTGDAIPLDAIRLKFTLEKDYEKKLRSVGFVSSRGLAAVALYLASHYTLSQAASILNTEECEAIKALEKLSQASIVSGMPVEIKRKLALVETPKTQRAKEFMQALGI